MTKDFTLDGLRRERIQLSMDWIEGAEGYPDDLQGEVLLALVRYCAYGKEPDLSKPHVRMAFSYAKSEMDKSIQKYLNGKQPKQNGSKSEANDKQTISKTEANDKQTISKTEANDKQNGSKQVETEKVEIEKENSPHTPYKEKDKDEKGKDFKKNKSKEKTKFVRDNPPTREEVEAYAKEKGYVINVDKFLGYYGSQGWKKKNGQLATSWKGLVATCAERRDLLEERKHNLVQDGTRLGGINRWMTENTPFLVGFMEHLFTAEEVEELCEKYGSVKISKVLQILEDRKEYTKKHTNLYLTVKEWLDKEPPSETPSESQPQPKQDDCFAWLPKDASPLYREFYIHLYTCNSCFFDKAKDKLPTQDEFQSLVDEYGYEIVDYISSTSSDFTDKCPDLYSLLIKYCPEEKEWRDKHGK